MIEFNPTQHVRSILFFAFTMPLEYFVSGRNYGIELPRAEIKRIWWKTHQGEKPIKFRIIYGKTETFLIANENNLLIVPSAEEFTVPHFQVCSSGGDGLCHYDEEKQEERTVGFDAQHNVILSRKNRYDYKFHMLQIDMANGGFSKNQVNFRFNSKYVTVEEGHDYEPQHRLSLSTHNKSTFILCRIEDSISSCVNR